MSLVSPPSSNGWTIPLMKTYKNLPVFMFSCTSGNINKLERNKMERKNSVENPPRSRVKNPGVENGRKSAKHKQASHLSTSHVSFEDFCDKFWASTWPSGRRQGISYWPAAQHLQKHPAELFAEVRDNGRILDNTRCVLGGTDILETEIPSLQQESPSLYISKRWEKNLWNLCRVKYKTKAILNKTY